VPSSACSKPIAGFRAAAANTAVAVADADAQRLLQEAEIDAAWVSPTDSRSKVLDPSRGDIAWSPDDPTE
jgi:hypothetical protein